MPNILCIVIDLSIKCTKKTSLPDICDVNLNLFLLKNEKKLGRVTKWVTFVSNKIKENEKDIISCIDPFNYRYNVRR